ncbi:MAG: TetR/AcrR family transcriptional regulator [Rhizobiaceae bacterium]
MSTEAKTKPQHPTRVKILDAAIALVRQKGYSAMRVEDVCEAAGVTKGAFFHHFRDKEELAIATARHWSETTGAMFAAAPYHQPDDPLERFLGYIQLREAIIGGSTDAFTCAAGTMAQETHLSHPAIRDAARAAIFDHAATLEPDIAAAKERYCPNADWSPHSLALFTQAALQGAFILAKADGGPDVARDMVGHLETYVRMLFGKASKAE